MRRLIPLAIAVCMAASNAVAQGVAPGDMWTQYAEKTGLFSPHEDYCSASEVFVVVGSGSLGFCIEEDERAADLWDDAKQTCAAVGKRLPEPAEFKHACLNYGGGLNNETGNYEWASNSAVLLDDTGGTRQGVAAPVFGGSACDDAGWGWVGRATPSAFDDSNAFRCVR